MAGPSAGRPRWRTDHASAGRVAATRGIDPGVIPERPYSDLPSDACPQRQTGDSIGLNELSDFLRSGPALSAGDVGPNTAFTGCSRLSAYLTWGCLSMREVLQTSRRCSGRGVNFESRLHWRCRFIQWRIGRRLNSATSIPSCAAFVGQTPSV